MATDTEKILEETQEILAPEDLVNKRIETWWDGNKAFYPGTLVYYDKETRKYRIEYEDGESEEEVWTYEHGEFQLAKDQNPPPKAPTPTGRTPTSPTFLPPQQTTRGRAIKPTLRVLEAQETADEQFARKAREQELAERNRQAGPEPAASTKEKPQPKQTPGRSSKKAKQETEVKRQLAEVGEKRKEIMEQLEMLKSKLKVAETDSKPKSPASGGKGSGKKDTAKATKKTKEAKEDEDKAAGEGTPGKGGGTAKAPAKGAGKKRKAALDAEDVKKDPEGVRPEDVETKKVKAEKGKEKAAMKEKTPPKGIKTKETAEENKSVTKPDAAQGGTLQPKKAKKTTGDKGNTPASPKESSKEVEASKEKPSPKLKATKEEASTTPTTKRKAAVNNTGVASSKKLKAKSDTSSTPVQVEVASANVATGASKVTLKDATQTKKKSKLVGDGVTSSVTAKPSSAATKNASKTVMQPKRIVGMENSSGSKPTSGIVKKSSKANAEKKPIVPIAEVKTCPSTEGSKKVTMEELGSSSSSYSTSSDGGNSDSESESDTKKPVESVKKVTQPTAKPPPGLKGTSPLKASKTDPEKVKLPIGSKPSSPSGTQDPAALVSATTHINSLPSYKSSPSTDTEMGDGQKDAQAVPGHDFGRYLRNELTTHTSVTPLTTVTRIDPASYLQKEQSGPGKITAIGTSIRAPSPSTETRIGVPSSEVGGPTSTTTGSEFQLSPFTDPAMAAVLTPSILAGLQQRWETVREMNTQQVTQRYTNVGFHSLLGCEPLSAHIRDRYKFLATASAQSPQSEVCSYA